MPAEQVLIMVLNDGETFSALDGCAIVAVPAAIADDADEIETLLAGDELPTIARF